MCSYRATSPLSASRLRARSGFTLVEILVTISIALVLISLTAYVALAAFGRQSDKNDKNLVTTISRELQRQWQLESTEASDPKSKSDPFTDPTKLVVSDPKRTIWTEVLKLAGQQVSPTDPKAQARARAVYAALKLRQQFPMNYYEALDPYPFPAVPAYKTALNQAGVTLLPATAGGTPGAHESAVCLLLALKQSRGGSTLNEQNLPVTAIKPSPEGLPMLVDSQGQPLSFYRWPTAAWIKSDPDYSSHVKGHPLDPDGLLQPNTSLNWQNSVDSRSASFQANYGHALATGQAFGWPIVVGSGRDKQLGITSVTRNKVDPMNQAGGGWQDNIYSYKLGN